MHFAVLKPVVLTERPSVIHNQGRCFRNPGFREHLDHVVIERCYRQGVLVAMEAVDHVSQIELQVQRTFGCWHHFQLF